MADKKISDFTSAASIADADFLEIETAAGNSRKVTSVVHRASTQGLLGITKLRKETAQSIVTGAWRTVTWTDEEYDNLAAVNLGASTSIITVPSGITYARATIHANWANNSTDTRYMSLSRSSGTGTARLFADIRAAKNETLSGVCGGWKSVVAGDTYILEVNGGTQTLDFGGTSFGGPTHLTIEWAASLADLVRA